MAKTYDRAFLNDCAGEVLEWIGLQDPAFKERIQITQEEYKLDSLQTIAMYCARVLAHGEHMIYAEYAFMEPGYAGHLGPRPCSVCGVEFTPSRGTDLVCYKQECLDKNAELLDQEFEHAATGKVLISEQTRRTS